MPRYADRYDDPLYDREDDKYGDYDDDELDGFSIIAFTGLDDPEDYDPEDED